MFVLFLFTLQLSRYVLFYHIDVQLSHLNKDYLLTSVDFQMTVLVPPADS